MKRVLIISFVATGVVMGQFEDIRPEDRAKLDAQALMRCLIKKSL